MKYLFFGLISFFVILLASGKKPDKFFWLFLMLFFDPGGFFTGYFSGNIMGRLNHTDLFFALMMICLFMKNREKKVIRNDLEFLKIFRYLLFFQIYYLVVYGFLVPVYFGRADFSFFLIKNRMFFMALPIMYGVYIFSLRNINIFYNMLIAFSAAVLTLYFLTLLTGLDIVPIYRLERYRGSGIIRISMLSYGFIQWIFPIGIITYLLKKRLKLQFLYERWIYYSAILMSMALLLTLTRRELLDMLFTIFIIIFVISYLMRTSKFFLSRKIVFPTVFVTLLLLAAFPIYFGYITQLYKDTFSLVISGRDTRGISDYRITGGGDLRYAKQIIRENLLLGTGYIPVQWSDIEMQKRSGNTFAMALDASAEVPIYGAFLRNGVVGVLLFLMAYIILIKFLLMKLKALRRNKNRIPRDRVIPLLFFLFCTYFLLHRFVFKFWTLFGEINYPLGFTIFCVVLALMYSVVKSNREIFT